MKTPPVLEAGLIETLDITLVPPSEDSGGLDASDLAQMTILVNVKHLRIRVNKGVRLPALCGTEPYYQHLGKLGRPLKEGDPSSGITHLSIYSPIPQPLEHCYRLVNQFPNLRHLVLDNVLAPTGASPLLVLPNLASFKLRNPVNLKFNESNGFAFLANSAKLESLALQGCDFDKTFLRHVLECRKKSLTTLELGTMSLESCPNRVELFKAHQQGTFA